MREMVLNHASLVEDSVESAVCRLKSLVVGMADLVAADVVIPSLRVCRPIDEINCAGQDSFLDTWMKLGSDGSREELSFLMTLATKAPIDVELDEEVRGRFLACEEMHLPQADGEPLLLCALTDWIAVGFPTGPWDASSILVQFEEMLPDCTLQTHEERIDNLSRIEHAGEILFRHAESVRAGLDLRSMWDHREVAFPHLCFGTDVEEQVAAINPGYAGAVLRRLGELNTTAERWRASGEPTPPWICKVTGESHSVRNNPALRNARRFRSKSGERRIFLHHARYGSGGRIHLRWDRTKYRVEIGYIGRHLPL